MFATRVSKETYCQGGLWDSASPGGMFKRQVPYKFAHCDWRVKPPQLCCQSQQQGGLLSAQSRSQLLSLHNPPIPVQSVSKEHLCTSTISECWISKGDGPWPKRLERFHHIQSKKPLHMISCPTGIYELNGNQEGQSVWITTGRCVIFIVGPAPLHMAILLYDSDSNIFGADT